MCVHLVKAAMDHGPDNIRERYVLVVLAEYADQDGDCWPSIKSIARRACVASRTVNNVLNKLETAGWITRRSGRGRNKSNSYVVANAEYVRRSICVQNAQNGDDDDNAHDATHNAQIETDNAHPGCARTTKNHQNHKTPLVVPPTESAGDGTGKPPKQPKQPKPAKPPKQPAPKFGIGEGDEPTPADIQHAEVCGIDWRAEWPKFVNRNIIRETRTTDRGWRASWRNWCAKALEFAERDGPARQANPTQSRMGWEEVAARAMARKAAARDDFDAGREGDAEDLLAAAGLLEGSFGRA